MANINHAELMGRLNEGMVVAREAFAAGGREAAAEALANHQRATAAWMYESKQIDFAEYEELLDTIGEYHDQYLAAGGAHEHQ